MSSTTPAAPASRPEAAARLDASARALVLTWGAAVFAASCFAALWLVMVALAVVVDRPLYVPMFAMMVVASTYNITRFIPREPEERASGAELSSADTVTVRDRLAEHTPVPLPERIVLTPHASVWIDDRETLHLGLPVALCLDAADVGHLVEEAWLVRSAAARPAAVRARRIAEGRLGRGLRDGPRWISRRLLSSVDEHAAAFDAALHDCARAERETHRHRWETALRRSEAAEEAWALVLHRWVLPALGEGHLQVTPGTGARDLLRAAAELGLVESSAIASEPLLDPVEARAYEPAVVRTFVDTPEDMPEVTWQEYPDVVLLPAWRRTFARGLAAVTRATGQPRPATLGTIVDVLEQGWGDTVAALFPETTGDGAHPTDDVLAELLRAAAWLGVLETTGTTQWRWPFGPVAILGDGVVLDVDAAALAAVEELTATGGLAGFRRWLDDNGIGVDAPIWLDGGASPERERVLCAVIANRSWRRNVVLVLSDRAVRVYDQTYVDSMRRELRIRMLGPAEVLGPIMGAVEAGDAGDPAVEVALRDVVHAEISSTLGGMYWRLRMWTANDRFGVFSTGPPGSVEDVLHLLLGDRLVTRWTHLPPRVQAVRLWATVILLGLGNLMILTGPIVWVTGDMTALDALATSVMGLGVVLLVLLPGMLLSLLGAHRRRRATGRGRRTGDVLARRRP